MTIDDPFAPFDNLRERIQERIGPLGLQFLSWNIAPGEGDEGDERMCSILMIVNIDAFLSTEDKETKKIFDEMLDSERALAHDEQVREESDKARQALLAIQNEGILPEVDDSPGA